MKKTFGEVLKFENKIGKFRKVIKKKIKETEIEQEKRKMIKQRKI